MTCPASPRQVGDAWPPGNATSGTRRSLLRRFFLDALKTRRGFRSQEHTFLFGRHRAGMKIVGSSGSLSMSGNAPCETIIGLLGPHHASIVQVLVSVALGKLEGRKKRDAAAKVLSQVAFWTMKHSLAFFLC